MYIFPGYDVKFLPVECRSVVCQHIKDNNWKNCKPIHKRRKFYERHTKQSGVNDNDLDSIEELIKAFGFTDEYLNDSNNVGSILGEENLTINKTFMLNNSWFENLKDQVIDGSQFSSRETSLSEVEKTIDTINVKSSPGIFEIPIKGIKGCKPIIVPFIVKLFNDCIAQEDQIEEWKCAIVTPLYKKGRYG
ncbi:unnamed protein product [Brachionus calyciflorus]|uniref:Uncharacterized protein n=1 Tax=Brachionus calyciflorus TaxID=104777 RepID=A0A813SLC8_9BILA|nr:unnamed protein product [Brachionus calyciflorus]